MESIENTSFQIERMESFPPGNPFHHDLANMGTTLGVNLTVMFSNHADKKCPFVILVNTETGERIRIVLDRKETERAKGVEDIINAT